MKEIKKLKFLLPFLISFLLVMLASKWINPGGIMALIPVCYFSIFYTKYMNLFLSLVLMIIIDYNQDTVVLYSFGFLIWHTILTHQKIMIPKEQKLNGIIFFTIFLCCSVFLQWLISIINLNLNFGDFVISFLYMVWIIAFMILLYDPITNLLKRLVDDR